MFQVNDEGVSRNSFVIRNALQIFFIAIPLIIFIDCFAYFSNNNNDGKLFFLVAILPFASFFLFLYIFATFRMIRKWNNTIQEINFANNLFSFRTFPIFWLKSKELVAPKFKFSRSNFRWYGKEVKKGITLLTSENKRLYLVEDYFDDFDEIVARIESVNT